MDVALRKSDTLERKELEDIRDTHQKRQSLSETIADSTTALDIGA